MKPLAIFVACLWAATALAVDIVTPWEVNVPYVEPGFITIDDFDGEAPVTATTVTGTVDVKAPGSYTLTYSFTNSKGWAMTATRRVDVADRTAPIITVTGGVMWVKRGATFVDPGATAVDAYAGPCAVTVTGAVDVNTAGTYTLTYTAKDPSGNTATAQRIVHVGNLPRITLN